MLIFRMVDTAFGLDRAVEDAPCILERGVRADADVVARRIGDDDHHPHAGGEGAAMPALLLVYGCLRQGSELGAAQADFFLGVRFGTFFMSMNQTFLPSEIW